MEFSLAEIGGWIKQFKILVRIPKMKTRKRKSGKKMTNIGIVDCLEIQAKIVNEYPSVKCSSSSASSLTSSTFSYSVSDFLRDNGGNAHSVKDTVAVENFTAPVDNKTSTHVTLKIQPLNRMYRRESHTILVHDVSGVKVYADNVDTDKKLFAEDTPSDLYENTEFLKTFTSNVDTEDGYEIVIVSHTKAKNYKSRTLKSLLI
jgi:hypothetical protein